MRAPVRTEVNTVSEATNTPHDAHRRGEEEGAFWERHFHELVDRYPDQFVAVRQDGVVFAASADFFEVLAEVRRQGLRPHDCYMRFLAATPVLVMHW